MIVQAKGPATRFRLESDLAGVVLHHQQFIDFQSHPLNLILSSIKSLGQSKAHPAIMAS